MKQKIDQEWVLDIPNESFFELCQEQFPEKKLFIFQKAKTVPDFLTGKALAQKAKILGQILQQKMASQEKALLVLPQGLEYIYSLLACFYANVIAVPIAVADVSQPEQVIAKINPILKDSQATCIITDTYCQKFLTTKPEFSSIFILDAADLSQTEPVDCQARMQLPEDIAILLYTSGSTSQPKGVMISHRNLKIRAFVSAMLWDIHQDSCIVSWLPQYHSFSQDLNIFSPMLRGASSVILTPTGFVKNPQDWLIAIDRYQATHIGAPNFAFDYCCSTIDNMALKGISLQSMKAIISGGEPVRKVTYENFYQKFKDFGLHKNTFCPLYGLSEMGTVVTLKPGQPMHFLFLDIPSLEQGKVKTAEHQEKSKSVASCGEIGTGIKIQIVHPESDTLCSTDEVGEIWIKSPAIGEGYFNRRQETGKTFGGTIRDNNEGGFLRTGDLGFIKNNHLYIVGREKEVIIIHGKNYHPVDIEWTIKEKLPELTMPLAVFSCEIAQQEQVIVVQEMETRCSESEYKKVALDILSAVSVTHRLELNEINLVKKDSIPRTGSGKIQRKGCYNAYINHQLDVLYQYRHRDSGTQSKIQDEPLTVNRDILETLKKEVLTPVLQISAERLELVGSFNELGLDSIQYIRIAKQIEEVFKIELNPVMLFEYQGLAELTQYLAAQIVGSQYSNTPQDVQNGLIANPPNITENEIAIIGMSCHFPGGAVDVERFWENLVGQKDGITDIAESRPGIITDDHNYYGNTGPFPHWGGFIDDVAEFDASFFNISPLEAESMDPQQRKLLELTWSVIEDSGYNPARLSGKDLGLFIGVHNNDYAELVSRNPGLMDIYDANLDSGLHMSMITHRVSRWFNFHGPSEIVNTACSSSLVAICHAVESIYRGDSSLAIAGGINLILTSRVYRSGNKAGMLSKDGRCKTFDESSDGFVRAEGYGAVLLKPYGQALKDGDMIYGVIKKAVINHDGKSNSLRAPNLNAQKELIKAAYQNSGLLPETISYIETHGTGTPLGDPIEIEALQEAFREINADLPAAFCGLGTVKTNIGHCESAAGIAGLIKVLLAMKYRTLPGILHFKKLNPFIQLQGSPFYIIKQTQDWKRLRDSEEHEIPLRAGISSFGFGGANAHVVVEEYVPESMEQSQVANEPVVFVLSARNTERLKEQAQRLLATIKRSQFSDLNLTDMAYTLQVGREAMEERLGIIAGSMKELAEKLQSFVEGRDNIEDLYHGQVKQNNETLIAFTTDDELQEAIIKWFQRKKYGKLLEFWVKGLVIDWHKLYGNIKPHRISLPTYPFAKESYWLPESDSIPERYQASGKAYIHPLLHQNTSDLSEQRFSSLFTGREFFFTDHVVNGQRILAGTACLEMVRVAVECATGSLTGGPTGIQLKNIVWHQPIIAEEQPFQVNIGLYPEASTSLIGGAFPQEDSEIAYEIYTLPYENVATGADKIEPVVYSLGKAVLTPIVEIPTLDLKTIISQCTQSELSNMEIYETFRTIGIDYGPGYQIIEKMYIGRVQALIKLSLPSSASNIKDQLVLHPGIDSALQASMVFIMNSAEFKPSPITIQELEFFGEGSPIEWVLIRYNQGNGVADKSRVPKFDIDLCDEQGTIRVRLKGYSPERLEAGLESVSAPVSSETLLLQFGWSEENIAATATASEYIVRLVILCEMSGLGTPEEVSESFETGLTGVRCLILQSKRKEIDKRFQTHVIRVFTEIQSIFKDQPTGNVLVQIVVPGQGEQHLCSGLTGLLKTARSENLKFVGQLIEVDPTENSAGIVTKLEENRRSPENIQIRYQDGKRWVAGWSELKTAPEVESIPWKDGGIYLITGGAGGLGLIFANEIVHQIKNATLILTGRSLLSAKKLAQMKELETKCSRIIYRQVDVCDKKAVDGLIQSIKEEYGGLQGIIHSAGVIRNNYIVKKTQDEILEVLAPKVSGLVNLDQATRNLKLDFFILFSSISGSIGNLGQADYSTANSFMDVYARYRNSLVASHQRQGQTLAINWTLWKEGGLYLDQESEKLMTQTLGLIAMNTRAGIRALYHSMNSGTDQVMVLAGDLQKIQAIFLGKLTHLKTSKTGSTSGAHGRGRRPEMKGLSLEQCLEWDLKEIINKILRIPRDKVNRDKNLAEFGFNSLSLNQLAIQLIKMYGISITPALFFGYSTVEKLTRYYITEYYEAIREFYREEVDEPQHYPSRTPMVSVAVEPKTQRRLRFITRDETSCIPEPIAIIGMSGRFPGARNIDELWAILAAGEDVVHEIPPERFDWRQSYGDPSREPGKTNGKWCGCIPGVREFDPLFFEISPREAETMDPRQRLLLQESWKALEDAGYGPIQIKAQTIGMFAGVEQGYYQFLTQGESSISSNNNAILAARLAYFLNLSGPVLAIDTACSSSLVAAHQAVLSLRAGECNTAIAAGVNLLLTPTPFIEMGQAGMLSEDGKCFTFDKRANGMVPGEAVAVVILKRLSQAKVDGDPIYAVIKGSGINYDGKTNGITAPSGVSQTALLKAVYNQNQVNPEDIEYIVTHGTGTKLGDPIEINALYNAFKDFTRKQEYCALTSTKTNFGHCLGSSGLVSLISLVQAIQHETIPASLHCEQENDYINWQESPFYVNKMNKPWPAKSKTLTGAVSAFGMSGTNAHMVVESYIGQDDPVRAGVFPEAVPYYLLAFSAKTQEVLEEKIQDMLAVLENKAMSEQVLARISYTLLEGRYHLNYRYAMVVQDREHALYVLKQVASKEKMPNVFHGKVLREFTGQKAIEQYAQDLLKQSRSLRENHTKYQETLFALADFYCQGYELDWQQLFGDLKLQRIHLPTYPFARDHYWVSENDIKGRTTTCTGITSYIHPLLHQNTSNLSEQRFSSNFTGEEFFFAEHIVDGQKVLPGVAHLEMVRAAVEQAAEFEAGQTGIRLKGVAWAQSITVKKAPIQVNIGLYTEDNGEIGYEIYSKTAADDCGPVIYSQGKALLTPMAEKPVLDLKAVQAECNERIISAGEVYETFKAMGIQYGQGYQGIEQIYVGQGQILVKLSLPASIAPTQEQFVLHPSMMDAALQAVIGFTTDFEGGDLSESKASQQMVPLSLQELEVFGKSTFGMWALIKYSAGSKQGDKVRKLDIDFCAEPGDVCVRLKGFSTRVLKGEAGRVKSAAIIGTLIIEPVWKEQAITNMQAGNEMTMLVYDQQLAIFCELCAGSPAVETEIAGVRCLSLQSKQQGIDKRFQDYATQVFEKIQNMIKNKPMGKVLIQIVVPNQAEQQLYSGLSGLLKTAQLENPKLIGQLIEIDPLEDLTGIVTKLRENSRSPIDSQIRYQDGKRMIGGWREVEGSKAGIPWRDHGRYLITGGAGGLGLIFAKEIVEQVKNITLILTGRSQLSEEKQAKIKELKDRGARVEYKPVDVTNKKAVDDLIQSILKEFGNLDGIIHSAGVICDNFIIKKTKEELAEVLAPKVSGLVNLDEATKDQPLDFLICFSSIAGSMGNPCQADYAAANAYMDVFAKYRNALVASNQRKGQTLSINWPLWQDGGMHVDESMEKMMKHNTGIIAMESKHGIQAMYQSLGSGADQVMVMEGDLQRLKDQLFKTLIKVSHSTPESVFQADPELLREKTLYQLKVLFGDVTKFSISKIDINEPLESYGIDSIMITQLNQKLVGVFSELSKTLFYEYQTLGALSEYLIADHLAECMQWTGLEKQASAVSLPKFDIEEEIPVLTSFKKEKKVIRSNTVMNVNNSREQIAIIGLSGRYPQANMLQEYWNNLESGKDSITEIPQERWPLEGFYHPDKQEAAELGKSCSKWGGFVDGFAEFDPLFFNISPREAFNMDPQERLFLESCWEVLEDAGYTREQLTKQYHGRVGVFAGITKTGFDLYGPELLKQGELIIPNTSFSSLANRVSYLLNLQGPSMPIDTACSSSLTAIHEACEHLFRGECELAIAGGVNLYLHSMNYIGLCAQQMLSPDGQCKSFGQGGNGFVPGEGVGIVLLKRLSQAVIDEDHIYAVIRGTSINHGGKTNGYTVPNPVAQGELIRAALDKAGVNARAVSYIEAHGTGTKLGDPIEVTGLTQAFRKDTEDKGYCAIGSVKTNIGHLEAAAGIAGLTKIIWQMKHQKLVPSLHSQELNPNIDFSNTPFVVQQELTEWKRPVIEINGVKQEYPRIAGISAFGAGGANAHVVVEEYISSNQEISPVRVTPRNPALIVLSAKNETRLKEQAQRLLITIEEQHFTDANLADIAYTLQMGREAMEERLGMIVGTIKELEDKLKDFMTGRDNIEGLYYGQVKRNQEALALFTADEDLHKAVESWINKGKYAKILDLWAKGLVFDWNSLYRESKPRRISLPTYPFAKECYWVPEIETKGRVATTTGIATYIHPLLQQNTSDLSEQRYSSSFSGDEFFLADHIVNGQKILPGVAYLEMARAAVEVAAGNLAEDRRVIKLKNVVWARPIRVGEEPVQVHIGIYPEENGEITYEVYSNAEMDQAEAVVYSQGSATLVETKENPVLDLKALQTECNRWKLSGAEVYSTYKEIGLDYGPGHQGIEMIYIGRGRALAKLSIPSSVANTEAEFVLHPSIMDAALQAAIGMGAEEPDSMATHKLSLPFALQELVVYNRCTGSMWATLQYSKDNTAADKIRKFDIDVCDEQGNVCVRMKGFAARVLEGEIGDAGAASTIGSIMFEPIWKEQAVVNVKEEAKFSGYTRQLVILCESVEVSPKNIETGLKGVRCLSLDSKQKSIEKRFQTYAVQVFEEIHKILMDKPTGKVLIQIVVTSRGEEQLFSGLSGILKTAQIENPKVLGQIIEIETTEDPEGLIVKLKENSYRPMDSQIRYQEGKRLVAGWREVTVPPDAARMPWKDGGVYLITGGTGGLGMIFAKEIATQVKGTTLVLTGRSSLDENRQASLKELEQKETKITYRPVDVSDRKAVNELIRSIGVEFGKLDGIIHCAGVIRDNYIIKKSKEELMEVLTPKVTGIVNIDTASKDLSLDFIIMFSSVSGILGNLGQADYATANAFMDAYARYRNALVGSGQRQGRTLSINWPLWQDGGMRVDETVEKMMGQNTGVVALGTSTGIRALYDGIASGRTQVMVMEGDIRQIRAMFSKQPVTSKSMNSNSSQTQQESVTFIAPDLLREKTSNYLKKLLSPVIKLPVERIEADIPMEKYGIDSIMVMQLTNQLEKTFGSLSKTLFFEYQTIQEISGYFLNSYREQLNELMGIGTKEVVTSGIGTAVMVEPAIPVIRSHKRSRFTTQQSIQENKTNRPLDIAIIGVSGRYPQARNVGEFWKILREGKDCITEVPKDRWDHSQYYDEDKNKLGKTYSKWGGFIDGVDQFDPLFFNISPREAEIMDPQERLFLECVYETLEDAGYTRETLGKYQSLELEGSIGVYVGVMYEEYQLYGAQEQIQGRPIALMGSASSIANRVSYFCNFHGPSVAIDTMCSSSLTSIHLACQSIQRGGCQLAIAGGVNVSIHPNKYLMLAQGKFASSKGRCESFGSGGDGYVPGEGVGAVLLKPLAKAIADGDQIYGVIKGTAINHGGKTNGYTVPNPNAQAGVIGQALQEAGIDPRTISYIEAHGTGTSLGDPIEITGLVKAFQKYNENKQFCAIGSAKSNIGHCESAAGIAGVTKVLLQLKYHQIAPSLHSEVLNPNIDFSNTPFVVQQELTEWERPVVTINGVSKEYPRIAGISSFGAGGSNAHIVIEEFIPKNQEKAATTITTQYPAIIVLSAKNGERLKEQIQQFLTVIREQQLTDANLADLAYTLQVGRESMEERLGIISGSMEELVGKLTTFLAGQESIEDLYRGQVKWNQEALSVFTVDEDMQKAVESWVTKRKYGKLLDLWVKGLEFDWNRLYSENKPRRISLPTYPFARERYWVPSETKGKTAANTGIAIYIHPLLHQNTSDFSEQRYSSTFTGEEFFLADHIVNGQKVLPGVAHLEMARAAVERASGVEAGQAGIRLKDVVWVRPIVVGEASIQINIGLSLEDNGEIGYEIYSETEEEDTRAVVYSQGRAMLTPVVEKPVLDLKAVQAKCNERILSATAVYEFYRAMGIEYGPGHRGIEQIYIGQGLILAKLSLPSAIAATSDQYILHPGMMDAALQASIGFTIDCESENQATKPMLPFALQELEMLGKSTTGMWALIKNSEGNKLGDKVQRLDIDLCDESGNICVRLKGFSARVLEGEVSTAKKAQVVSAETTPETQGATNMLTPVWDAVSIKRVEPFPALTEQVIMVGGTKEQKNTTRKQYPNLAMLEIKTSDSIDEIAKKLEAHGTIDHILWLAPQHALPSLADEALIKEQSQGVLQVYRMIKALLRLGYGASDLGWSLITNRTQAIHKSEVVNPTHASLHGLVGSMAKEYPNWKVRLIDLESNEDWPISDIFTIPPDPAGNPVAYRGGECYQQQLIPVQSIPMQQTAYKIGGVYVVIGGAGGIGEVWSEYVIRTYQAKVIWIGRREKDEAIQAKIDRLASLGPIPQYIAADATDQKSLQQAYDKIKECNLEINGVIHSAIVLLDKSLANMEEEQFQAGLSAKVDVSGRIAQVFGEEPLDFVLFFSSVQSFTKAAGQSNYASGCTFKDAFAHQLNLEWPCTVKVMNWGYWGNAGVVASKVYRERMAQAGIGSIEPPEAMEALERLLAGPMDQIALMKTTKPLTIEGTNPEERITLYPKRCSSVIGNIQNYPIVSDFNERNDINQLLDKIATVLQQTASKILMVRNEDIDVDAELKEYGFDPVMLTEFINRLNKEYRLELTSAIFFKYSTIRSFAEYLVKEYQNLFGND